METVSRTQLKGIKNSDKKKPATCRCYKALTGAFLWSICVICIMILCLSARKESELEKQRREEERLLEAVAEKRALMAVSELARGVQYEEPVVTAWRPPKRILAMDNKRHERVRKKYK